MVLASTSATALLVTSTFCKERQHVGFRNHQVPKTKLGAPGQPLLCSPAPTCLRAHTRTTHCSGGCLTSLSSTTLSPSLPAQG